MKASLALPPGQILCPEQRRLWIPVCLRLGNADTLLTAGLRDRLCDEILRCSAIIKLYSYTKLIRVLFSVFLYYRRNLITVQCHFAESPLALT